jgi:hypothetical protein
MQASSDGQAEGAAASDAAAAQQEEAALLVFDVLAAAGQQLNGSARWDLSLQHHCGSGTAYHDILEFTSTALKEWTWGCMHCQFAESLAAPKATRNPLVVACVLRSALVQCVPDVLPQLQ